MMVVYRYSWMVVGWAIRRGNLRHGPICAVVVAIKWRRPALPIPIDLDQDLPVGTTESARLRNAPRLGRSLSRGGEPMGKRLAKSIVSKPKKEGTRDITVPTRGDVRPDIIGSIERLNHRKRGQSQRCYLAPLSSIPYTGEASTAS